MFGQALHQSVEPYLLLVSEQALHALLLTGVKLLLSTSPRTVNDAFDSSSSSRAYVPHVRSSESANYRSNHQPIAHAVSAIRVTNSKKLPACEPGSSQGVCIHKESNPGRAHARGVTRRMVSKQVSHACISILVRKTTQAAMTRCAQLRLVTAYYMHCFRTSHHPHALAQHSVGLQSAASEYTGLLYHTCPAASAASAAAITSTFATAHSAGWPKGDTQSTAQYQSYHARRLVCHLSFFHPRMDSAGAMPRHANY